MFSPPTLTHAECRYQRPAASGICGFAMRPALSNGLSTPRKLQDCLIQLTFRLWFAKGIVPQKFVAVLRKLVYKTQFSVGADCRGFCLGRIWLKPSISIVSASFGRHGACSVTYAFTSHIFRPVAAPGAPGNFRQSG